MPDERRFHDRRRPSDREITAAHNESARQQILDGTERAELRELDTAEPRRESVEVENTDTTPERSPERDRVREALRRAVAGSRGRSGRRVQRSAVPAPPPADETPDVETRREFLKSRGVDDDARVISHPVAKTGQGHTRTTFTDQAEYDHPTLTTTTRRRR